MKNEIHREPITISRKTAAELSGLAEGTLANLACRREGPPFFRRGRKVLYDYQTFIGWLRETPVLTKDALPKG